MRGESIVHTVTVCEVLGAGLEGRKGGREGGRERGREGGRERGREGEREGRREYTVLDHLNYMEKDK